MRANIDLSRISRSFALWALLASAPIGAEAAPDCPPGNLLHGRRAVVVGADGDGARATDHFVAPEGAVWDGPQVVILPSSEASLTWDLSRVVGLRHLVAQADGDDEYLVETSLDGQHFEALWQIPATRRDGLRRREANLPETRQARYLRFGQARGDGRFALAELQVFCAQPTPFPPPIPEFAGQPPRKKGDAWWTNDRSARSQLVLALLGLALLGAWGRLEGRRKLRDGLLLGLGILALGSFFNFGAFHFPRFVHDWEWTHYYLGAKYFDELDYDKLYECIAVADEQAGLHDRVASRKITNLRTNVLEGTAFVLAHPERCTGAFSAARWQNFKHDVAFFRDRQSRGRWEDLQTDHGYNATPVWTIAGSLLANISPAGNTQLHLLALLDPLYLLALILVLGWAFGWRTTCVAMLVLATHFPARFFWTGGAFLRWDWLFFTGAAIACLRKERPMLAGLALGYAALLRVFPLLIFAGPVLATLVILWRERRLDRTYLRFFVGAALAAALLLPLGAWVSGGVDAYPKFVENTLKHKETPLTNHMGLRTLVAYRPGEAGHVLHDSRATDPWLVWKKARLAAFERTKPLYFILVAAFLVLLGRAVRHQPPWIAAALGIATIAVGVELTCYYYAFLLGVALLHAVDRRVGLWLLAVNAGTHLVDWHPFAWMPEWRDEQYTWMSAITLAGLLAIVWAFRSPPEEGRSATAASPRRVIR